MERGQNQNSYITLNSRMQPGSGGAPLMLKSELLYHPELRGWSLGLKSERLYITLSSEDGALD